MKQAVGRCWVDPIRKTDKAGYVRVEPLKQKPRKTMGGHYFAYTVLVGEVPEGMELDHVCKNPACYNPAHLEPVTHVENIRRSARFRNGVCPVCQVSLNEITAIKRREPQFFDGWIWRCRFCHNNLQRARWHRKKHAPQVVAI